MKKFFLLLAAVMAVSLISCDMGNNQKITSEANGSISGKARFGNADESSGIIVTLEKTDGLRSVGVVRSIETGSVANLSRAALGTMLTQSDGAYSFTKLEDGLYTVYASTYDSVEKAVATNIVVNKNESVIADDLILTATGNLSGKVTLDESETKSYGFTVYIAGTSYIAMTDIDGKFTISGIPAGSGYHLIITKQDLTYLWEEPITIIAKETIEIEPVNFTSDEISSGKSDGKDGTSIRWLGSFDSSDDIENPQYLDAFFNKTDGCSYIYDGTEWTLLASKGEKGDKGDTVQSESIYTVRTTTIEKGNEILPYGGVKIEFIVDGKVVETTYISNGEPGKDADKYSIQSETVTPEDENERLPNGGTIIRILKNDEVIETQYISNGTAGTEGKSSTIRTTEYAPGVDENLPDGGIKIEIIQDDEIIETRYIKNGQQTIVEGNGHNPIYIINYILNGGSFKTSSSEFHVKGTTTKLGNPVRANYGFGGWYVSEDFSGEPITELGPDSISEDITLYAKWYAPSFVAYDLDGGTLSGGNASVIGYKETITLPIPTKTNYVFRGWYTNPEYEGDTVESITALGDEASIILYARWYAPIEIDYKLNGGSFGEDYEDIVVYGKELILPVPSRINYGFGGWFTESDFTGEKVTSLVGDGTETKITLYAKWLSPLYIYCELNGGRLNKDDDLTIFEGETVKLPIPIKDDCEFAGWYTTPDFIDEPIGELSGDQVVMGFSLYAKWYEPTWITYLFKDDETYFLQDPPYLVCYKKMTELPILYKENYVFAGWYTNANCEGEPITEIIGDGKTEEIILYPKWYEPTYLKYYLGDGYFTEEPPYIVLYESTVILPEPANNNYTFEGWYLTPELDGDPVTEIQGDSRNEPLCLYAKWGLPIYYCMASAVEDILQIAINEGVKELVLSLGDKNVDLETLLPTIDNYGISVHLDLNSCTELYDLNSYFDNPATTIVGLYLPESLWDLRKCDLECLPNLRELTINKNNKYFNDGNGSNCIIDSITNELMIGCNNTIIPNNVTAIGDFAFSSAKEIESIEIPKSVKRIGYRAFGNLNNLKSINMPDSVLEIEDCAFCNCTNLVNVRLSSNLREIKDSVFENCEKLEYIEIPGSVTKLNLSAFEGCTSLHEIIISNGVKEIVTPYNPIYTVVKVAEGNPYYDSRDNCNAIIETATNRLIFMNEHSFIPISVTAIKNGAIANRQSITEFTIPDSILSVESYPLWGFDSLNTLTIPASAIANYATLYGPENFYYHCPENIIISDSVTSIPEMAFYNKPGSEIVTLTIPVSVVEIGSKLFNDDSKLTVINYKGSEEDWYNISFGKNNDWIETVKINFDYQY